MTLSWWARLFVSLVVLATLLAAVQFPDLASAAARVSPGLWATALLVFLTGHVVSAFKWRLLILHDRPIAPGLWLRAHFAGLAANLCLPGIAGGDVVRAAWIGHRLGNVERVTVAAVADRGIDCLALLTIAGVGAAISRTGSDVRSMALLSAGAVGGVAVVASFAGAAWLRRAHGEGLRARLGTAVRGLLAAPFRLAVALVLSLAVQMVFVMVNYQFGRAAGIDTTVVAWMVAWPLAKLVSLVPVSLAGLGVREAALVAFMRPFGAPAAAVAATGLLWQSVLFAGGLMGWAAGASGLTTLRRGVSQDAVET